MARGTRDLGQESYWRIILARWRRSGLSVRAFCQAEGVSEPKFYSWRRALEAPAQPPPAFLPVDVVGAAGVPPALAVIEVVLANGRCLRVRPGFDPHTLVTLVALLETGEAAC